MVGHQPEGVGMVDGVLLRTVIGNSGVADCLKLRQTVSGLKKKERSFAVVFFCCSTM